MTYSLQKDNETIIELSDDFVNRLIKDLQELADNSLLEKRYTKDKEKNSKHANLRK